MAGSYAEACSIISSVKPAAMGTMATAFRSLSSAAVQAASAFAGSATEVGGQHGAPYAAYEERLTPTATWVQRLEQPVNDTATALQNAQTVSQQAQWVMAEVQAQLAQLAQSLSGADPAAAAAAMAAAMAQALAKLNAEIGKMTTAFNAVQPPDIGTAPKQGGSGTDGGATSDQAVSDTAGETAGEATGETAGQSATSDTATGPQSGEYAGWVQDPTTGNLVDPATGREVDSSGHFLDPVTGQPFGDPSQYASRLEGLQGGVGGQLSGGGGLAPAPLAGAAGGGGGGGGGYMPYYGGMVPPSMMGANPAAGQLRQKATNNLSLRAETARRYNEIASGQTQPVGAAATGQPQQAMHPYLPPMGGVGAGAFGAGAGAGGARGGRRNRSMVSEPADIWGATGRGARGKQREQSSSGTEVVEDVDVWTGGETAGSGVLGGR